MKSSAILKNVFIEFEEEQNIAYYEVQWLLSLNQVVQNNSNLNDNLEIQKIVKSPIDTVIKIKYNYFRIRSINKKNKISKWSKAYSIKTLFFSLPYSYGEIRMFLNTSTLSLDNYKNNNKLFYSLNDKQRKQYTSELFFKVDGENFIYLFKNAKTKKPFKLLHFWVDRTPPQTKVHISPPLLNTKSSVVFGKSSKIKIISSDFITGINKIFFRIYAANNNLPVFTEFTNKLNILNFVKKISDKYILEFYSNDKIGNMEKIKKTTLHLDLTAPIIKQISKNNNILSWKIVDSHYPITVKIYINGLITKDTFIYKDKKILKLNLKKGNNIIKIVAEDPLNNKSKWEKEIQVP